MSKIENFLLNEEEHDNKKVKILNIWNTDFGDIRSNALLYQNNQVVGNVIISADISGKDIFEIETKMKALIYKDFDKYVNLPKITKCSNLLQEIYFNVCESEESMCHITEEDWKNYYATDFNDHDIEILKEEVEKYNLKDVITFDDTEYKIIGWADLETMFNDDKNFEQNYKNRILKDDIFVCDVGYKNNQPVALIERTNSYGKEYIIVFNYTVSYNKMEWDYERHYGNNISKAKDDFKKVLSGESLECNFVKKEYEER